MPGTLHSEPNISNVSIKETFFFLLNQINVWERVIIAYKLASRFKKKLCYKN